MWRKARLPTRLFKQIDATNRSELEIDCGELCKYLDFVGTRYLSRYQCSVQRFTKYLETNAEEQELKAALMLCRRRNISDSSQKSLGVLARAGFSYSVSMIALKHHLQTGKG